MRVLVVEDEKLVRDFYTEELDRAGYHAVSAVDGASALAMLRSSKFDAVICDMVMPRMGGLELVYTARKEGTLNCPVVVVTGVPESYTEDMSVADLLVKPVRGIDLVAAVERVTRKSN